MQPERIAIVGPESTGKSELAIALGRHFNVPIVQEYAREHIALLKRPYTEEDLLVIAQNQCRLEDEAAQRNAPFIICDTNLLVIKVWSLHSFGHCNSWIEHELQQRQYSLHLLTNIDLPWQPDPQREHPHLREYFFNRYHHFLILQNTNYEFVTGTANERTSRAVKTICACR